MCQLLGISANRAVDLEFSLREWKHRGRLNPDGYGFAHWNKGESRIVKRAVSLWENQDELDEIRHIRSKLFICHVRLMSCGAQDGDNTHPFKGRNSHGDLVFAHNGTVRRIKEQRLETQRPQGNTDSEHAFCWLLENLDQTPQGEFSAQLKHLADRIRGYGRFNFLLSDGTTLWVYADNSLYYIQRTPPYGGQLVELKDDGYSISLAEVKGLDETAMLIATRPLTDEASWKQMLPGELLVMRNGEVLEDLI